MNLETLKKIFDTFYQLTYITTTIIDKERNLCFPSHSPLYLQIDKFEYLLTKDKDPIHIINTYQVLLASFTYEEYTILIGPCNLLGAKQVAHDIFAQYQTYVATSSLENFCNSLNMIYTLLTHKPIDSKKIPIQYLRLNKKAMSIEESFEKNLFNRRSQLSTYDSYQFELRFLDYIKRGKKDKINWIFTQMGKTYPAQLSINSLETTKIKIIATITLITRMAIDLNVPLDSAFSLSDSLIQNLSNIKTIKEGIDYLKYGSYQFIDLIHATSQKCSTLMKQCISYIDTHLYEKISLSDLEDVTGNSSVYISSLFKKELNKSFTQFLLERKIEEAKHLLLFTDHSFQSISTLLCFTSQSHFTQRFKQVTKQTPKEFRNKNFQYM